MSQFLESGDQSIKSFSFNISPSNEHSGLISFRMDWLDLLAVQVTVKSLLQHHSSKASILWCSAFFIVQLSHPYMTTGKTIVLTRWTFVGKAMSLLFNMLSRLVITFILGYFEFVIRLHSLALSPHHTTQATDPQNSKVLSTVTSALGSNGKWRDLRVLFKFESHFYQSLLIRSVLLVSESQAPLS